MMILLLFIIPFMNCDEIVQTNSGPVKGISSGTGKIQAFLGIPYAEPPLGPLRFAKPVPKSTWDETYDAKRLPPACVQAFLEEFDFLYNKNASMSEDCLYLNLWVPKTKSSLKPVMVFIHGGGYMVGSSNTRVYDGAALSENGDVIVASINYRVGTLGFFSGFIDEAAGSMGMYDQVMAIQWIKDNAKHFGGDPDNIVLFGESAGAFSVSLHLISPLSRSLFRRGILQSGSTFSPLYTDDNKGLFGGSQMISLLLGCASKNEDLKENPKDVVACMKNLPSEKFSEADSVFLKNQGMLVPRVGDDFLPVNPTDAFRKGDFKNTEVLFGVTKDEGTLFIGSFKDEKFGKFGKDIDANTFSESSAKEEMSQILKIYNADDIIQSYFKRVKKESRYSYLQAISDFQGDFMITCPTVFHAEFQSLKSHPAFFYLFDYRSPSLPFPEWMGVPHFLEVPYVFGNPIFEPFTESEEELSKDMMDMWVAFAKTGNPNIPGGLKWPAYTYEDPKYFIIGRSDRIGVRPDNFRCEAWRNMYRGVIDKELLQNFKHSVD